MSRAVQTYEQTAVDEVDGGNPREETSNRCKSSRKHDDVQTRKQLTLRNTVLPPSPHARSRPLHAPTFGIGSPSPGEGGV